MTTFAGRETVEVGDVRITHLPDGGGYLDPVMLLPPSTELDWAPYARWRNHDGRLYITIGGILIETPDSKVLVDPGVGPKQLDFEPMGGFGGGDLLVSLEEHGLHADDIDVVTFTHLHTDHIGWTSLPGVRDGALVFPRARHVVNEREWDYWRTSDDPQRPGVQATLDALASSIQTVGLDTEIVPGVSMMHTPGHTPGHTAIEIRSGDQRALLLGDAIHSGAQITHCGWQCVGDADGELASKTRESLVKELCDPAVIAVTAHFPNSVFGRVKKQGDRYVWVEGAG